METTLWHFKTQSLRYITDIEQWRKLYAVFVAIMIG